MSLILDDSAAAQHFKFVTKCNVLTAGEATAVQVQHDVALGAALAIDNHSYLGR
jgi:hypothetical protein